MAVIGRPTHYDHLIAALDNDVLYTPESIWDFAMMRGLIAEVELGKNFQDYKANAIKALKMRAVRKLPSTADGYLKSPSGVQLKAYFGYRWKSTLRGRQGRAARKRVEQLEPKAPREPGFSPEDGFRLRSYLAFYAGFSHVLVSFLALAAKKMLRVQPMLLLQHYYQTNQKTALLTSLYEPRFEAYRSYIVTALAGLNGKTTVFEGHLDDILGIFLFEGDRGFFHHAGQVRCGQSLVVNGISGVLYYISTHQLVLSGGGELHSFELPAMGDWISGAQSGEQVYVYGCELEALFPNENLCATMSLSHPVTYIAGCFKVRSFAAFVETLSAVLDEAMRATTRESSWLVMLGIEGVLGPARWKKVLAQTCQRLQLELDVTKTGVMESHLIASRKHSGVWLVSPGLG